MLCLCSDYSCQGDVAIFLHLFALSGRDSSLTCQATIVTHTNNSVIVLSKLYTMLIFHCPFFFLCLEKLLFPKLAIFTGPADGRGHPVESRLVSGLVC